ncbi:MAG: NeuD/PglB/VioB family sugar acetyltransferase [Synergistaceae bacterium]|nr:NeuD/PglB/VioB family sugar acetyltransferase [Synergistaceae bacterium]
MTKRAERIVIYGAGGLGREILHMLRLIHSGDESVILGFVDDGVPAGTVVNGLEVIGGMSCLSSMSEPYSVVLGMAEPGVKRKIHRELAKDPMISFPNIIHPASCVSDCAALGEGVVIAARCEVSVDVRIRDCAFLNVGTLVGHDVGIGAYSSIMSMTVVSGNVNIGEGCMIGVHSAIRPGVRIGSNCVIDMGSIVLRDIPDGAAVFGNPARRVS